MNWILKKLDKALLTPIKAIKKRYIPLLLIYFAYGAQGLTAIALTFWEKENLSLSAEQLVSITVWVSLPWTIKMIFGQLVDVVPLCGSKRKAYVYLGAGLMALGYLMLYGMATENPGITWIGSQFNMYLASSLVMVLGFLIQDVTADAMSTEVVDRNQKESAIKKELTLIQILGRLSLMIAAAVVAGLSGYLADKFTYEQVFLIALIIPVISVVGATFVKLETSKEKSTFDINILGGGIAFAIFTIAMAFSSVPYSQEIVLIVSFGLLSFMLRSILKGQDKSLVQAIVLTFAVLFIFRATPSVGPGYNWWAIDVLGFDEMFFGLLKQISSVTALVVLWLIADYIASRPVKAVLLLLIVVELLFDMPNLMLYYQLHEVMGISARTMALFDTAVEAPLVHISMIPMLALIAYYAPVGKRATWFAVAASFMNLALSTREIFTKYLNQLFIISRETKDAEGHIVTPQDYSELGMLLWSAILISFFVPLIAVLVLLKDPEKPSQFNWVNRIFRIFGRRNEPIN